jgi:general stress protein YciG
MTGTPTGGARAAATNKEKHGEDFYARIGRRGGSNGKGPDYKGGFAGNKELARLAGIKGGRSHSPFNKINPDEFIKVWMDSESMSAVGRHFDIRPETAKRYAQKYREQGYALPYIGKPPVRHIEVEEETSMDMVFVNHLKPRKQRKPLIRRMLGI